MNRKYKRVHILGASGSGTSTLGRELSTRRGYTFLDTDDYFWKTKYSEVNRVEERVRLIRRELDKSKEWVLSGSLCGWGDVFIPYFDLVIFIYLPNDIRMNRLQQREEERYGHDILPGGVRNLEYIALIDWAAKYDSGGAEIRSKFSHEKWLEKLNCPILRFEGDISITQKIERFDEYVGRKKSNI